MSFTYRRAPQSDFGVDFRDTHILTNGAHVVLGPNVRRESTIIRASPIAQTAGFCSTWICEYFESRVQSVIDRGYVPFVVLMVSRSKRVLEELAAGAFDAVPFGERVVAASVARGEGGTAEAL